MLIINKNYTEMHGQRNIKTSVRNCHNSTSNNPEQRSSHLLRSESLKSRSLYAYLLAIRCVLRDLRIPFSLLICFQSKKITSANCIFFDVTEMCTYFKFHDVGETIF